MSKIELISLFRGNKKEFIKIIAHVDKVAPQLLTEGWVKTVDELSDSDSIRDFIIACQNKDEIERYIGENFKVDLDKRLSLENMKEAAMKVIDESKRVD